MERPCARQSGKNVLCLASGDGQDSVAFGLLGAKVTLLDLSDVQLEYDRQGAAHHGLSVTTIHGYLRDLSVFPDEAFDVVWQVYSDNFVPSVESVWDVAQPDGSTVKLASPHEFRHTLGTVMNTLAKDGFILLGLWEWMRSNENPAPGSWMHFTQVAPQYLSTFWRLEG